MKKLLIVLSALFLLLLDGCGCSGGIDYYKPMYVSPTEYEKLSCKELNDELQPIYGRFSCKELKEKLVYISPTEYEKLSCKQLNEQFTKINERLDVKSKIETEEAVAMVFAVPFFFLTTAGVPLLMQSDSDSNASSKSETRKVSESEILKGAYKSLKDTATKKNCSFATDMR